MSPISGDLVFRQFEMHGKLRNMVVGSVAMDTMAQKNQMKWEIYNI